jgi:DNA-binding NarL/FixJ family response regulator
MTALPSPAPHSDPAPDTRAYARRATLSAVGDEVAPSDEAWSAWDALLDGRASLHDAFDVNGIRYVVVRRTALADVTRVLTCTERRVTALVARGESLKFVALELDLSASRVSQSLARALVKLGLPSRSELMLLFGELAMAAAAAPAPRESSPRLIAARR